MTIYTHMQAAVDIVQSSPHPDNKIAATIAMDDIAISLTNHWPAAIANTIGTGVKIGNSSGTIHAETACIFAANTAGHSTQNASIFITDPPCPNCVKNIAEAGIAKLYIDHKGFDKDWARRRGDQFENMSMRIAEKAGLDVFVIHRKEQRFEVISKHPPGYQPIESHPPNIEKCNDWEQAKEIGQNRYADQPFAIALAKNSQKETVILSTDLHPTIGYTSENVEGKDGKYSFILQPLNRLLMIAAREGLILNPDHIYSSRCPTSRELVNFIGAGLNTIEIGNIEKARDEHGPFALQQLQKANILKVK